MNEELQKELTWAGIALVAFIAVLLFAGISEIYAATYVSVGLRSIFEYLDHLLKDKSLLEAIDIFENLQIPFVSRNGLFKACIGAVENAFLDMCAKLLSLIHI